MSNCPLNYINLKNLIENDNLQPTTYLLEEFEILTGQKSPEIQKSNSNFVRQKN